MEIRDRHSGEVLFNFSIRQRDLRGVYLGFRHPADLRHADLRGLDMSGADVTGRDLSDADLTGTNLSNVRYDARTRWPAGVDMERWGGVCLPVEWRGAKLDGQDWSGHDFTDTDMRGVSLANAQLRQAILVRANLRGANLAGADLTGADLTDADCIGIRYDAQTRWPEGFDPVIRISASATDARREEPTTMEALVAFLKALADPNRLRILGLLTGEEATGEELADALELSEATISHHLNRLKELGLVRVRPDGARRYHQTDEERLTALLRSLPGTATRIARGNVDPEAFSQKTLKTYFEGDRLREIPLRYKKQRIILTRLVEEFQPGVRYHEREVNEIFKRFHPDFAALRRYMIDHRFMARENNIYWRLESLPPPL
ncbi:MAG: metalloregulator ArsR/SmtB family transcription factor [bacterium]